jgi:hypothetical protein
MCESACGDVEQAVGPERSLAALSATARVEEPLVVDADGIVRSMGVAVDHDVSVGELSLHAFGSASGGAAVMDHGHRDAIEIDDSRQGEPITEAEIVVAQDGVGRGVLGQSFEQMGSQHVAGVKDDVSALNLAPHLIGDPAQVITNMGIGQYQYLHLHSLALGNDESTQPELGGWFTESQPTSARFETGF